MNLIELHKKPLELNKASLELTDAINDLTEQTFRLGRARVRLTLAMETHRAAVEAMVGKMVIKYG